MGLAPPILDDIRRVIDLDGRAKGEPIVSGGYALNGFFTGGRDSVGFEAAFNARTISGYFPNLFIWNILIATKG